MDHAEIEDREDRAPLFSMRTKAIGLGAMFLGGMVLIATPGMPYLAAAIQEMIYGSGSGYSQNPTVIGQGWLLGAELSPTGSLLATMSESAIHIWYTNGTLLSTLHAVGGIPWAGLEWSPGGDMIGALDYLGNLTIASVPGLSTSTWRKKPIYDLAIMWNDIWRINTWPVKWSPNGSMVAFGYCDARTHILNMPNQRHIELPNRPGEWIEVRTIDWSPTGNLLVKSARKSFVVYDTQTLVALFEIGKEEYSWGNETAAFSPDGTRIATLKKRADGSVQPLYHLDIHGATQGELLQTINISVEPMDIAWSPDSRLIAMGTRPGTWYATIATHST